MGARANSSPFTRRYAPTFVSTSPRPFLLRDTDTYSPDAQAVLLSTDTEVSIAPKLHRQKTRSSEVKITSTVATDQKQHSHTLRLLPSRLVPNVPTQQRGKADGGTVAYVALRTFASLAGLHFPYPSDAFGIHSLPSTPSVSDQSPKKICTYSKTLIKASVRRLLPPQDPEDLTHAPPPPLPHGSDDGVRLDEKEKEKETNKEKANKGFDVWIVCDTAVYVPNKHLFVPGGFFDDMLEDWDLLRCFCFFF
jgi:hypothetical protein